MSQVAEVAGARTARSAAGQVRTAERTLLRAAVNGDTRTAGALLASDLQLIDVTGTPETRADYLANIGGGVDFVTLRPFKPISVRVHGDNGVTVAGTPHAPGGEFEWKIGETMLLGRAVNDEPQCSLTLSRAP